MLAFQFTCANSCLLYYFDNFFILLEILLSSSVSTCPYTKKLNHFLSWFIKHSPSAAMHIFSFRFFLIFCLNFLFCFSLFLMLPIDIHVVFKIFYFFKLFLVLASLLRFMSVLLYIALFDLFLVPPSQPLMIFSLMIRCVFLCSLLTVPGHHGRSSIEKLFFFPYIVNLIIPFKTILNTVGIPSNCLMPLSMFIFCKMLFRLINNK